MSLERNREYIHEERPIRQNIENMDDFYLYSNKSMGNREKWVIVEVQNATGNLTKVCSHLVHEWSGWEILITGISETDHELER